MTKTTKSTGVVLSIKRDRVLAGENTVDTARIERAVTYLNDLYISQSVELLRKTGEHLLETFFDGDMELARSRRKKHVSMNALGAHPKLLLNGTDISRAIATLDQLNHLPPHIADALHKTKTTWSGRLRFVAS